MPRFGIAWDILGSGRLVVHSAYGIFYDTLLNGVGGPIRAATQTAPWTVIRTRTGVMDYSNPLVNVSDPFVAGTITQPVSLFTIDSNLKPPYAQNWNLAVDTQVFGQTLTVEYAGTKGTHLPRFIEGNPAVYVVGATAANADRRRIYADCTTAAGPCGVASVALLADITNSNYHAAEVRLSRNFSHGLAYNFSYTYSKTLDYVSSLHMTGPAPLLVTGELDVAQNPLDLNAEYGPSLFDARHRFVASGMWDLPFFRSSQGWLKWAFGNWQLNSIVTVSSATPYTVYDSRNVSLQASHPSISGAWGDRPDVISNPNNNAPHSVDQWVSPGIFRRLDALTEAGQFGNERRNAVRGPGYGNLDISMVKVFPISERWKTQFRAECFNATNHTNFGIPVNDLNSPSFGRILSASSPRVLQFAIKVLY